jgi:hypothetical protein
VIFAPSLRSLRLKAEQLHFFYVDRRHMRVENLERASIDLINGTTHFSLPSLWGTGKRMAGDGTHMPTWSKNRVGEMHIRYGAYGGIAYHFVGDTYAVISSTFITCGTWETVYILDAFKKSDVTRLSPYFTEHVLRFGEFVIDPDELFANLLENTALPDQIMRQIDWSPPD